MRISRQNAQVWVLCVVSGLVAAGLMTAFALLDRPGSNPVRVVLGGLVVGVFVGAVTGWFSVRQRRVLSDVVGDLSPGDQQAATSAASRGPVPPDDDVRLAAARIAAHQLASMARLRLPGLILFGAFFVLEAFVAVTSSPKFWGHAAFFAAMFALQLWGPRHLQRRVDLLTEQDNRA